LSSFLTRRKFLQIGAAGTAVAGLATVGDGMIFRANRPQVVSIDVHLPRLAESWDGFRIAQLSDFHYDDLFSVVPLRKAVDIVNQLQPDLIVLTGDFVSAPVGNSLPGSARRAARVIEPCTQLLTQMRAPSGMLAVLGNHDLDTDPAHVAAVLRSHAIPVLRNHSTALEREGKRLWIVGVDDVLVGKPDLDLALREIPPDETVVLLAHEPDWADHVAHYPVDLQLSGHSHGGQIRLPFVGVLYLPDLARKYPWGLRRIGPLSLYTNAGIGTIRVAIRLNCPPEITLITLRSGKSDRPSVPAISP
jgi:uncharacterized protein